MYLHMYFMKIIYIYIYIVVYTCLDILLFV